MNLFLCLILTFAQPTQDARRWEDRLLDTLPADAERFRMGQFSSDGRTVAYAVTRRGHDLDLVIVNGRPGKEYDDIQSLQLGPDGRTVAYRAKTGEKWCIVVGEEPGDPYDKVWLPVFSPDGKHVAYGAEDSNLEFMILDGRQGPAFDKVHVPFFSPDGKTLAYAAEDEGKAFIVVGGKKGPEFDGAWWPVFSPDGQTVAYGAKLGAKQFLIIGEKRCEEFDEVFMPEFSHDGKQVAYVAKQDGKAFVVRGTEKSEAFDNIAGVVFGPDGLLAYAGRRGKVAMMVWGDRRGPAFEEIDSLLLGPDAHPRCTLVFSPDGKRLAYRARDGNDWQVMEGHEKSAKYDSVGIPVFSPDGRRLAYAAAKGRRFFVVVDGKVSPAFDFVGNPVFSPDGASIGFGALSGNQIWWKVLPVSTLRQDPDPQERKHKFSFFELYPYATFRTETGEGINLILDTAGHRTLLAEDMIPDVDRAAVPIGEELVVIGGREPTRVPKWRLRKIVWDEETFPEVLVGAVHREDDRTLHGTGLDGIAGYDFFCNKIVSLDYFRQEVAFLESFPADRELTLPFELEGHVVKVKGEIRGHAGWFVLDTGAPYVSITSKFRERAGLPPPAPRLDAGGKRVQTTPLPGIKIGTFQSDEIIALVEEDLEGDISGVLGSHFLSQMGCVTIDYPSRRLAFPFRDSEHARRSLIAATERGEAWAEFGLANSRSVRKRDGDVKENIEWLLRAADHGHPDACEMMGEMFLSTQYGQPDFWHGSG